MKKENKYMILTLLVLLLIIVGATYAFFQSQTDGEVSTDVNIETKTTDSLSFVNGDSINIKIDANSFNEGGDNATGETNVKARLQASNVDYEATEKYYLYLKIDKNEFIYSTPDLKPELILEIKNPSGDAVTKVTGLDYVTVNDISGFDITAKKGTIPIVLDYDIKATENDSEIESIKGTKEQTWEFKITFVNLNSDQQVNAGKSLVASALITHDKQEDIYTDAYHTTCKDNTLACHIAKTYGSDDNLVYHDSNLYLGASDLSYRFSGGEYKLTGKDANAKSIYDILKIVGGSGEVIENNYFYTSSSYYYLTYDANNHLENLKSALEKGITDGYIKKTELNNYVCFGSTAPCPENNLYQVIGLFKNNDEYQVKLIKADYASKSDLGDKGSYVSDEPNTKEKNYLGNLTNISIFYYHLEPNTENVVYWSQSALNLQNLNQNFWGKFESNWQSKISSHDWQEEATLFKYLHDANAKVAYDYELGNNKVSKTTSSKIGIMYVSEYYYGADKKYWYLPGYNHFWGESIENMTDYRSAIFDNWLYKGVYEWLLTPNLDNNGCVYRLYIPGNIVTTHGNTAWPNAVRPTFYLNSNVNYVSGTGTREDPIIID